MTDKPDEYSKEEIEARLDRALRRALKTSPEPRKPAKAQPPKRGSEKPH
jgi:hypothetical protein